MRELWVISGVWWQLPVIVIWHGDRSMAAVTFAQIPMLDTQIALLRQALDAVGEIRMVPDQWWMTADKVKFIAREWSGSVEDAVIWAPPKKTAKRTKVIFKEKDRDDFIDFYIDTGGLVETRAAASVVFEDFCRKGLEWMVRKGRALNLGWITLYPIPYRADWMPVVMQMCGCKGGAAQAKLSDFKDRGWLPNFLRTELLSVRSRHHATQGKTDSVLHWTVGVKLHRSWHATVRRSESQKRDQLGAGGYLRDVVNTVKNLLPGAIEVLLSYLRHSSLPCADVRRSGNFRNKMRRTPGRKFLPEHFAGRQLAQAPQKFYNGLHPKTYKNGDSSHHPLFPVKSPNQTWQSLVEEDEGRVLSLSDLQSEPEDLRDTGEDFPEQRNGEDSVEGMPVPDALREPVP